jgi:hypothetical protein
VGDQEPTARPSEALSCRRRQTGAHWTARSPQGCPKEALSSLSICNAVTLPSAMHGPVDDVKQGLATQRDRRKAAQTDPCFRKKLPCWEIASATHYPADDVEQRLTRPRDRNQSAQIGPCYGRIQWKLPSGTHCLANAVRQRHWQRRRCADQQRRAAAAAAEMATPRRGGGADVVPVGTEPPVAQCPAAKRFAESNTAVAAPVCNDYMRAAASGNDRVAKQCSTSSGARAASSCEVSCAARSVSGAAAASSAS